MTKFIMFNLHIMFALRYTWALIALYIRIWYGFGGEFTSDEAYPKFDPKRCKERQRHEADEDVSDDFIITKM